MSIGTLWSISRSLERLLTFVRQLHTQQDHPDEGILAHANELVAELEGKGVRVEMDDEEGDVDMQ